MDYSRADRRRSRHAWTGYLLWGLLLQVAIPATPPLAESFLNAVEPLALESPASISSGGDPLDAYDGVAVSSTPCFRLESARRGVQPSAAALFWTVREGSADNWAQIITPEGLGANVGTATLVDAPFDWNAGFRVGLGFQNASDDSGVSLRYTNFSTVATSRAAGEVYSAFLGNFYADNTDGDSFGPHYRSASIRWDFDFHAIDLQFRRSYPVAPNLTVRPFVGLKTAFIDQSVNSHWRQPIDTLTKTYHFHSATEDLKQYFWGIGPSLGVTLEVPLCKQPRYSLKLFGTPSGSLMYGHWTFSDHYRNDGPTSIDINTSPITSAATMVGGAMGLEWTQHFARASTTLRIGYEAEVWLNQMQFYSYNMGRLNNLMSLHGGILKFSINY